MKSAEISIVAELGQTDISIEDLLYLQLGDVIQLNTKIEDPLLIKVGEIPKFTAQPGKLKNRMAVQVIETVKGGEEMMSDDMLSQEEIEALLRGNAD